MELNNDLGMTEEMRAELTQRRRVKDDTHTQNMIRSVALGTAPDSRAPLLPFMRDGNVTGYTSAVATAHTRALAATTNSVFRRRVYAACDIIDERVTGLVELACDAGIYHLGEFDHSTHIAQRRLCVTDPSSPEVTAVARGAERLRAATQELTERVELEQLRADAAADLSWMSRRAARREAARAVTKELELFLDALDGFDELTDVGLAADEILAAHDAAIAEVDAVAAS